MIPFHLLILLFFSLSPLGCPLATYITAKQDAGHTYKTLDPDCRTEFSSWLGQKQGGQDGGSDGKRVEVMMMGLDRLFGV